MSNNNSLNIDKNIMEIIDNELFWDTIKCLNVVREERHKKGLKKLSDKITEGHIKTLRNLLYYLYDDHQEDENENENDIMNCCECNRPIKTNNFIKFRDVKERNDWLDALNTAIEDYRSRKATFMSGENAQLTNPDAQLGESAPVWIPDQRVTMCQVYLHILFYRGRGHCDVYYTSTKSFVITFSYSLLQQL